MFDVTWFGASYPGVRSRRRGTICRGQKVNSARTNSADGHSPLMALAVRQLGGRNSQALAVRRKRRPPDCVHLFASRLHFAASVWPFRLTPINAVGHASSTG